MRLPRPYQDAWSIGEMENEFHRAFAACETQPRRSAESCGRSTPYNASPLARRVCNCRMPSQKESVGAGDGG